MRKTIVPEGVRVPGTDFILDPIKAAFDIGTMIRWLDYNDTLRPKSGDILPIILGGILSAAHFASNVNVLI